MKNTNILFKAISLSALALTYSPSAKAISPIIRSFDSVRAEGMGDVRYTTGIFEENFFGNPARMTENPENLFQLPKFTIEAGSSSISELKSLLGAGGGLSSFTGAIGEPLSARFQMIFPAYYNNHFITDQWTFAVGLVTGAQMVGQLSQTGNVTPNTIIDVGPAVTVARRLLPEDRLSVGITAHTEFRATSGNAFSIIDFLNGKASTALKGGSGLGLDFDLGTTFLTHWGLGGFSYELGAAMNNVLGGAYDNMGMRIAGWNGNPTPSPRSVNFGLSARKSDLWKFKSFLIALEFTDLGNNVNGSFFRTIHLGTEAQWHLISVRAGMNQGYLSAGLGFNFKFFSINLATYGEEMGLNVGSLEDRRYALDFGFQI